MNLKHLKELAEKATNGPWTLDPDEEYNNVYYVKPMDVTSKNDASFIAAANPATILELIKTVETMREALELIKTQTGTSTDIWLTAHTTLKKVFDQ